MNSGQKTLNLGGRRLRHLAETLQLTMARYGYELVDTPIVQPAELFLTKAGDRLITRLFTFERHGKELALRPEFTATAAYDYVRQQKAVDVPVARWQYSGPIFLEASERSGLDYPHYSVGAELIGLSGPLAEAEIMSMAVEGATAAGLHGWHLHIGHVGLMRRLLGRFNLDARTQRALLLNLNELKTLGKAALLERLEPLMLKPQDEAALLVSTEDSGAAVNTQQMLDALLDATQRNSTMGGRSRHDIVRRLLQKRQRAAGYDQIVAAVNFLIEWGQIDAAPADAFAAIERHLGDDAEATTLLADWKQAVALLEAAGVASDQIRIQPDLARSWDYYTGVVFELYAFGGEHLAGGGRYDELIALVGGRGDVPAAGFVYYPDEMLAAARALPTAPDQPFTIVSIPDAQLAAVWWARQLRSAGKTVTVVDAANLPDAAHGCADGNLTWRDRVYTPDAFSQLLTEIERA